MTIQIQRRGGSTKEHSKFTGKEREITVDTDKKTLIVHDGVTPGGYPLLRDDLGNITKNGLARFFGVLDDVFSSVVVQAPVDSLDGFLLCDGCEVSRVQYKLLFHRIGTKFGIGDGETTFNIPDYRGLFLRGLGGESAPDFNILQLDAAPNITGSFITNGATSIPQHKIGAFYNTGGANNASIGNGIGGQSNGYGLDASISSLVYGRDGTTELRPTNMAINYFIKY